MILQQEKPDDFVIGTGKRHSLKDFLNGAFSYAGLDWEKYVEIDPRLLRPSEVNDILAGTTKARQKLNWLPKVSFDESIMIMIDCGLAKEGCAGAWSGDFAHRDCTWFDRT